MDGSEPNLRDKFLTTLLQLDAVGIWSFIV
jgi:hypothetical protein